MCKWDWILNPARARAARPRLMVRALLLGGVLMLAAVSLAFSQTAPQPLVVGGAFNTVLPTYRSGFPTTLQTDSRGRLLLGAGGSILGSVSIDQTTPGTTNGVTVAGKGAVLTDKSGTITSGGVAQVLAAANTARTGLLVQNVSVGDLWINSLATAVAAQPSIWLPAGSYFQWPSTGVPLTEISILGATTGQGFTAREW